MYTSHMSVKTVSLKLEAYERLRAARRYPTESFSEVVLRARWPEDTVTGAELLRRYERHGASLTDRQLDAIEAALAADQPPEDKWAEH
jgi:predicted CopG family antitoxin